MIPWGKGWQQDPAAINVQEFHRGTPKAAELGAYRLATRLVMLASDSSPCLLHSCRSRLVQSQLELRKMELRAQVFYEILNPGHRPVYSFGAVGLLRHERHAVPMALRTAQWFSTESSHSHSSEEEERPRTWHTTAVPFHMLRPFPLGAPRSGADTGGRRTYLHR